MQAPSSSTGKNRKKRRKRKKGRRGTRPVGPLEEQKRVEKREQEYSDILSALTTLGNPFDDLNIEEKRHALFLFFDKMKVIWFGQISAKCLFVSFSLDW